MAIGWWLETGIYSKMENDVGENQNWTTEWTQPTTHEQESLKLSHLLIMFILFGAMITVSIIVFGLELLSGRVISRVSRQRRPNKGFTIPGYLEPQEASNPSMVADGMPNVI